MRYRILLGLCAALGACYDPQEVDCTVSCAAANECASGQVCGSDGFCAAPSVAGHCGGPDAGMTSLSLRVTVNGPGRVMIDGVGMCDDGAPGHACVFSVSANLSLLLRATPKFDHEFRTWMGGCNGGSPSCALTPVSALTQVGAAFQ